MYFQDVTERGGVTHTHAPDFTGEETGEYRARHVLRGNTPC